MTPIQELIEEYERKVGHCTELMSEQKENSTSFRRILAKRSAYKQIIQSLKDSLEKEKQEIIETFDCSREFDSLDGIVDIHIVLNMGGDVSDLQPYYITAEDYYNDKHK